MSLDLLGQVCHDLCAYNVITFSEAVRQFRARSMRVRGSVVVSISACHAEDPGSIPGRGISTHIVWRIAWAPRWPA